MQQEIYETIIVGGGIAGIGCLRTLGNRNALLLTKNIGGRICVSEDGCANYGAYYVRQDYKHVLPFVRVKRRIHAEDLLFKQGKQSWRALNIFFQHPILMVRFLKYLKQFDRHYQVFKKKTEHISQQEALKEDPFLKFLFEQDAKTFLDSHNLTACIPLFLDAVIRSSAFLDVEDANVSAGFMFVLSLILLHPAYEFAFDSSVALNGFEHVWKQEDIVQIDQEGECWKLTTETGSVFRSKFLVMATPIHVTKQLLHLDIQLNQSVFVHMAHVRGKVNDEFAMSDFVLFPPHESQDIILTTEPDGTHIFYSHNSQYDLSKYFLSYDVIAEKYWHPAFFIGKQFVPTEWPNKLFVIGDHNICGMEDAHITGIFAANRINQFYNS